MPQTIFCPGCGEGVSTGVTVCPACGTFLPQPAPEPPAREGGADAPTVIDHSPYGWMDSAQPPRPVTPIPPATPPVYQPPAVRPSTFACPGCGRVIPVGVAFCPQCGRNLQQTAQQFPPQHGGPPPPFGSQPALPGPAGQNKNEQMLVILLAVIAACIILGFFC